ncbi:hypothetical protein LUX05_18610 [Streptomyces somaliensis]|nr:hypothetical protein [Streptomyces somaliensis]
MPQLVRQLPHRLPVAQEHQARRLGAAHGLVLVDGEGELADQVPHVGARVEPVAVVQHEPEQVLGAGRLDDHPVHRLVERRQRVVELRREGRHDPRARVGDERGEAPHDLGGRRGRPQQDPRRAELPVLGEVPDEGVRVRAAAVGLAVDQQHRLVVVRHERAQRLAQLLPVEEHLRAAAQQLGAEHVLRGVRLGVPLQPGQVLLGVPDVRQVPQPVVEDQCPQEPHLPVDGPVRGPDEHARVVGADGRQREAADELGGKPACRSWV